jgi:hypothetical protein
VAVQGSRQQQQQQMQQWLKAAVQSADLPAQQFFYQELCQTGGRIAIQR